MNQKQGRPAKCFNINYDPDDDEPYPLPAVSDTLSQRLSERKKRDEERIELCKKMKKAPPKKSSRLRHFHEKVNNPEVANEADRQLQEQLNCGLRNFYANNPLTHSHKVSDPKKNVSITKSQDSKKTVARENIFCTGDLRASVPEWALDMDLHSPLQCGWHSSRFKEQNKQEDEVHFDRLPRVSTQYKDEDNAIPSWAHEVTINTLNETFSFPEVEETEVNDKARRYMRTNSRASESYLNNLPEWVRNQGNLYINKKHARGKKRCKTPNQDFYLNTLTNLTHFKQDHNIKDMDAEKILHWPLQVNYVALEKYGEDFASDSYKNTCSNSDRTQLTCPKNITKQRTCELQNYGKNKNKSTIDNSSRNSSDGCSSSANQSMPKSSETTTVSLKPSTNSRKKQTSECKGQEFISSLMKNPIEAFEKLMAYLMKPGVVDEEDITGVEAFDEYDSKPITISEGDNFLAFIKEKHLQQGIDYCNIAAEQTVKQFISKIRTRRQQEQHDLKAKLKEQVMNSAQTNTVKEIHEADDQIEIIGYVGCTGYNKSLSEQRKCNQEDNKEDENYQQGFDDI